MTWWNLSLGSFILVWPDHKVHTCLYVIIGLGCICTKIISLAAIWSGICNMLDYSSKHKVFLKLQNTISKQGSAVSLKSHMFVFMLSGMNKKCKSSNKVFCHYNNRQSVSAFPNTEHRNSVIHTATNLPWLIHIRGRTATLVSLPQSPVSFDGLFKIAALQGVWESFWGRESQRALCQCGPSVGEHRGTI